MLYHLDFDVAVFLYNDPKRFIDSIWSEEADAGLGAKAAGVVSISGNLLAVGGLIAIFDVETLDDRILLYLPIMKLMGQHVQVKVTRLRRYQDFAADVKERLR